MLAYQSSQLRNRTLVAFPDCFSLLPPGFQIPIFKKWLFTFCVVFPPMNQFLNNVLCSCACFWTFNGLVLFKYSDLDPKHHRTLFWDPSLSTVNLRFVPFLCSAVLLYTAQPQLTGSGHRGCFQGLTFMHNILWTFSYPCGRGSLRKITGREIVGWRRVCTFSCARQRQTVSQSVSTNLHSPRQWMTFPVSPQLTSVDIVRRFHFCQSGVGVDWCCHWICISLMISKIEHFLIFIGH